MASRQNSTMGKAKKAPPQGPFYDDYVEAINKEPVNKRNRALFGLQMSVQEGWGWWKPGWKDGHVARTYEQVKDVLRNIVDFEENEWMQNENMSLKEMRDNIQNNITGNTELQNQLTYLKEHIAEGNPKFLGEEEIDDLLEVIENKINADNFSPEERDIELVKLIQLTELTCTLIPSYLYYSKYKFKIENIVINQILHKIDLNGPGAARLDEMPTLRRIYRVYLLRLRENAKSSAPTSKPRTLSDSFPFALKINIGVYNSSFLIFLHNSNPFKPGNIKSRRIRSTSFIPSPKIKSKALDPSLKVNTSKPSLTNDSVTVSLILLSSSIRRIFEPCKLLCSLAAIKSPNKLILYNQIYLM